jgi:hypothetical protein
MLTTFLKNFRSSLNSAFLPWVKGSPAWSSKVISFALQTYWTPVFTGVTPENQIFQTFGGGKGGGDGVQIFMQRLGSLTL